VGIWDILGLTKEKNMDNLRKQTIVLARLNELLDMQLYLTTKKVKLEQELKQLEEEENKKRKVA
tara:strand:+ start:117 stop:308 length:192 start_codon:yes stop_codon:yes gene_type:complete